jgi:hypothetical protein
MPSEQELAEYLKSFEFDEEVEPGLVSEIAAGVMHHMLDGEDDYLQKAYPKGTPELLKEIINIIPTLTGDALERAAKLGYIVTHAGDALEKTLQAGGAEAVKEYLKEAAEEANGFVPGHNPGGPSHNGNWMASGITAPPAKLKNKDIFSKVLKLLEWEAFQAAPSEEWVQNDDGTYSKIKTLENVSDLPLMNKMDLLKYEDSSLMMVDLFTGNLQYEEIIDRERKSTDLVVLIDDSGSMCNTDKISWVKALIICLFEKVVAGDCSLYIGMFEVDVSPFIKIDSVTARDEFLNTFRGGMGGETYIDHCLEQTVKYIQDRKLPSAGGFFELQSDLTEIVIINDGQDKINRFYNPGHMTHVITLFGVNYNLGYVSEQSGGTALFISYRGDATPYSDLPPGMYDAEDYDE